MIEEGVVIVIESLEFNPNSIFFDGIFFHGSLQCFDGISPYHPHYTNVQYVHAYIYIYIFIYIYIAHIYIHIYIYIYILYIYTCVCVHCG